MFLVHSPVSSYSNQLSFGRMLSQSTLFFCVRHPFPFGMLATGKLIRGTYMNSSTDKNVGFYLGTAVLVAWRIITAVAQIIWYVGEAVWRDNWREPAGASAFLGVLLAIFVGWPAWTVWLMLHGNWWPLLLTVTAWSVLCLAIAASERERPWFTLMTIDH